MVCTRESFEPVILDSLHSVLISIRLFLLVALRMTSNSQLKGRRSEVDDSLVWWAPPNEKSDSPPGLALAYVPPYV